MRKTSAILRALAASLLVTACGGGGGGEAERQIAPATCPLHSPRLLGPGSPGLAANSALMIRPGPAVASVCQYADGIPADKTALMLRRIVLHGGDASGLAALIDSAGPAGKSAARCDRPADLLPYVQEIFFGYAAARSPAVLVAHTDCGFGIVTANGHWGVLSERADSDLFSYTASTRTHVGAITPDLVGLTPQAALATASRIHFSLKFDGAVIDGGASVGTVAFQSPPPGVYDSGPGGQVGVILAVHPAPRCATRQLALGYLGGGAGAGNDFGTLLVRDTSVRACTLTGPLRVTGLRHDGQAVTSMIEFRLAGVTVLSPRSGPVTRRVGSPGILAGVEPGQLAAILPLIAAYRDAPSSVNGGLCVPLWVIPATWRVAFPDGHALKVANADPQNPGKLIPSGGIVTCRGRLGPAGMAQVKTP